MTEDENSTKYGYIDDEVAISHKRVGDAVNVGIVKDESGYIVIHGKPDFVINPLTGKKVKIKYIMQTDKDTKCPHVGCEEVNGPGINIRVLEGDILVYECPKCKNFTFCKIRGDE